MSDLWLWIDTHAAFDLWAAVFIGLFLGAIACTWRRMDSEIDTLLDRPPADWDDASLDRLMAAIRELDDDQGEYRAQRRNQNGSTRLSYVLLPFGAFVVLAYLSAVMGR